MAAFTIGGDWEFDSPDQFFINVATDSAVLNVTPTLIQLGYGEGAGYSHDISTNTVQIFEINISLNASLGTLSLESSSGSISEDAPTIDLGTSLCTVWNAGNANCVVSLVGQNFGITANGTFEASGTAGSTYYDAATLDIESPTITLGTNSSITTAINVGNASSALTANSSTFDMTTTGTLNWSIGGYMQVGATDGFVFTGGVGANLEFNSPMVTFNATDIGMYPSGNLTMGTATAPIFMTGQYLLLQTPGGGFMNIDMSAAGGNIRIAYANATELVLGNTTCTNIITGTVTQLILATPAVSNNTPLLIDTNGTLHV